MCHMLADTPEELLAMARKIGVAARWFQGKGSAPHFDICKSKRALAVAAGAREIDRAELSKVLARVRASWPRDAASKNWLL